MAYSFFLNVISYKVPLKSFRHKCTISKLTYQKQKIVLNFFLKFKISYLQFVYFIQLHDIETITKKVIHKLYYTRFRKNMRNGNLSRQPSKEVTKFQNFKQPYANILEEALPTLLLMCDRRFKNNYIRQKLRLYIIYQAFEQE